MSDLFDTLEEMDNELGDTEEIISPKRTKLALFIGIFVLLLAVLSTVYLIIRHNRMKLSRLNVYICENEKEFSDFDNWVQDDLGIDWVPTFIVIHDKTVVGTIRGTITVDDFKSELGSILINPSYKELPNYPITNIDGQTTELNNLIKDNGLYFIEIAWLNCPDCVEQEKFNPYIYAHYNANRFYMYYLKSDKNEVINHYEK